MESLIGVFQTICRMFGLFKRIIMKFRMNLFVLILVFIIQYATASTNNITRIDTNNFGVIHWDSTLDKKYPHITPAPGRCEISQSVKRSVYER